MVYTDASDDACGAQLSQEHNTTEFPIAFLFHTFMDTQRKWSTTEQEAYRVYHTVTKWNYYLQELKLSYAMTTNHCQDFSMERMPITK